MTFEFYSLRLFASICVYLRLFASICVYSRYLLGSKAELHAADHRNSPNGKDSLHCGYASTVSREVCESGLAAEVCYVFNFE